LSNATLLEAPAFETPDLGVSPPEAATLEAATPGAATHGAATSEAAVPVRTQARRFEPDLGLVYSIADRLAPLFMGDGRDFSFGIQAALDTLIAYGPRRRIDYADVARHVAFTLASLSAIGQAATPGMADDEQCRYLSRASTLSRAADQARRALDQRALDQRAPKQRAQRSNTQTSNPVAANTVAGREPKRKTPDDAKPEVPSNPQAEPSDATILGLVDDALAHHPDHPRPAAAPAHTERQASARNLAQPATPTGVPPIGMTPIEMPPIGTTPVLTTPARAILTTPARAILQTPFAVMPSPAHMVQNAMRSSLLHQTAMQTSVTSPMGAGFEDALASLTGKRPRARNRAR
jgi:hypothetical protein